ncbi:hypothetical protein GHT06_009897 [Daphnia sinensis]|uniref:HTH CENPB-type domain-containing protein n=1 Tax=Daphnia sinensis TaxID=1820382 RepID=A0AAD5KZG8_9CRUS|nr:hypothetical protein GHT06_009897 [Daphnia sinensis]
MVRHYIRKTERCMYPDGYILKAVKKVVAEKQKVCDVSKATSIPKRSILRYVKNFLAAGIQDEAEATTSIGGYQKPRKVFSSEQESNLSSYVIRASDIYHGITTTDMRRLAYQYATQEKCIVPLSWSVKKEAGRDWLSGFMRRHQDLSIRKPQATSLSRATSFNKHNVDSFFDNVEVIRSRGIPPSRWFNADDFTDVPSLGLLVHKNNMGFYAPIHGAKCPFNGASRLLILMFSNSLFGLIKVSFCKLKIRGI